MVTVPNDTPPLHAGRTAARVREREALQVLLVAASAAERSAVGQARIRCFRVTRRLLGAAVHFGFPPEYLAEVLGVTVASLRSRIDPPGAIAVRDFVSLLPQHITERALETIAADVRGGQTRTAVQLLEWYLRESECR